LINITNNPVQKNDFEVVRRKGIGEKDSLSDGIAEAILSAFHDIYLRDYGEIQPAEIQEVKIFGGKTEPKFGGGKIKEPSTIFVKGIVAPSSQNPEEVVLDATIDYLGDIAPLFDINHIISHIKEGDLNPTEEQRNKYKRSFFDYGMGYAVDSFLQKVVYRMEEIFYEESIEYENCPIGYDTEITGIRNKDKIDLHINSSMIDKYLSSEYEYNVILETMDQVLEKSLYQICEEFDLDYKFNIEFNKNFDYLTTMGTQAERLNGSLRKGNGCNGLITPLFPMQLVSGLDAEYNVNKIYSILSTQLAETIIAGTELQYVDIFILNNYGNSIKEPKIININTNGDVGDNDLSNIIDILFPILDSKDYPTF
jgi:S-adenosylmethionine synthetase